MILHNVLVGIFALVIIPLMIYGKYVQARRAEERRDHKSGIQTLFDGEK